MVNATDLFGETQALASEELKKNSAITTRVAERYNTTANRLKMLAIARRQGYARAGMNAVNWSGTVTKIEVRPNWRYLL